MLPGGAPPSQGGSMIRCSGSTPYPSKPSASINPSTSTSPLPSSPALTSSSSGAVTKRTGTPRASLTSRQKRAPSRLISSVVSSTMWVLPIRPVIFCRAAASISSIRVRAPSTVSVKGRFRLRTKSISKFARSSSCFSEARTVAPTLSPPTSRMVTPSGRLIAPRISGSTMGRSALCISPSGAITRAPSCSISRRASRLRK